jgi:histidinol-phosphate/aromatic aminotransferase/cobyric acid decarboxylase-like protein
MSGWLAHRDALDRLRFVRVTVGSGCDNEQFLAALSEVART